MTESRSMRPILCVGELLEEHENGEAIKVVDEQLEASLKHLDFSKANLPIIAYEPVWSIGTGKIPDIGYIVEIHSHIRDTVAGLLGVSLSEIKVLYGGSVTEENIHSLLRESEVDGVLIGGASLRIHSMTQMIDIASDIIEVQK